jgi:hypothetical protein
MGGNCLANTSWMLARLPEIFGNPGLAWGDLPIFTRLGQPAIRKEIGGLPITFPHPSLEVALQVPREVTL